MSWNIAQRTLGPLHCTVVETEQAAETPELAVVLCHGFGAPGTDLVPLGPELIHRAGPAAQDVRFYFPAAPLSLAQMGYAEGRAWWMLDLDVLAAAAEGRLKRDLRDERPEGLDAAAGQLRETVEAIAAETGLSPQRIVLGGFSQGAMVTTDVALSLAEPPTGLLIYSGTLLCQDQWRERARGHAPGRILQSHGTSDPLLPFESAEALHALFEEAGCRIEFVPFPGPHTIPPEAVDKSALLIGEILANP